MSFEKSEISDDTFSITDGNNKKERKIKSKLSLSIKSALFKKNRKTKKSYTDDTSTGSISEYATDSSKIIDMESKKYPDSASMNSAMFSGDDTISQDTHRLINAIQSSNNGPHSSINSFDTKFLCLINEISKDFSNVRTDIKTNSDKIEILKNDVIQQLSYEISNIFTEMNKLKSQLLKTAESNEIMEYRLNERMNELEDAYSSLNNMVNILNKQQLQHVQTLSVIDKYLVVDDSRSGLSKYILQYLIPVLIFVVSLSITAWNRLTSNISQQTSTGILVLCVLVVLVLFMFYF